MIDTHCHLDGLKAEPGEVIDRARQAGVTHMATVGTDPHSIERALETAHAHPEVVAIVGRHPHQATGFRASDLEVIAAAASDPAARAIGETGLDYYRDHASRSDQKRAFAQQLELAARTGLPVVIHNRAADADTFAMLAKRAHELCVVMHCFSAPDRLDECVKNGYYCSFAGNVTFPKARELQAACARVPDQLLLVETDSPYLAPQPVRGRPNEPKHVVDTAAFVADLRGVSYAQLEAVVEQNAAAVFGW